MNLSIELKKYATKLDIIAGFGSADKFEAPPDRRPKIYIKNAKSVISIGYKLNYSSIQNLPLSRSAYGLEHLYANRHLDQASHKIARFLEERGFDAIGFDNGAGHYYDPEKRFAADFSHKHAAVICGLGKFGLNNLLLSPKWGPRIRLAAIITNAKLKYDHFLEKNPCLTSDCEACVRICPVHALDEWKDKYDPERGWVIAKKRCYDYWVTTLRGQRCGLCIKACPIGLNKQI
jgi:epoxyqueuosine reductase QueG